MSQLQKHIELYIERGFGSMNKNDFEVFIFGQMLEMSRYKGKTNYELSLLLRVPESKIKRLRYESALRSSAKNVDYYKSEAYQLLSNAVLRGRDKKVVFVVEDVMLRLYITSLLKKEGRMIDSSFNPELVVIHIDDFRILLDAVCDKSDIKKLYKEASKAASKEVEWADITKCLVEGAISGTASAITSGIRINLQPLEILHSIKSILSK